MSNTSAGNPGSPHAIQSSDNRPVLRKAGEEFMADIHAELAQELSRQMREGTEIVDKKGRVTKVAPTPALLNVIRQFLRDNGVQSKPEMNTDVGELLNNLPEFETTDVRPKSPATGSA